MGDEVPRPRGGGGDGWTARPGGLVAPGGGAVLLGVAPLTCRSEARRRLTSRLIAGDFEPVPIGSGTAVLGFLAWGTAQRASQPRGHLHRLAAARRGGCSGARETLCAAGAVPSAGEGAGLGLP